MFRPNPVQWMSGALVAALATVVALAARAPSAAPPPRDVLVVGLDAEPKSLDPQATTALSDFRVLVNVCEGLVRYAPGTLEVAPSLATSWTISPNGLVYTFHLRRHVHFQDGTRFDAQAVKFDFDRMLRADAPYHDTGPFPLAFFFKTVRRVVVLDDHTVQFRLSAPFAPLLSNLAYPTGLLISPAAVRRWKKDVGRHPVGTGPFRFVSWQSGRRIVLERNDHYWGRHAKLERVVFRPIVDDMTRAAALLAGRLDVVTSLSPDNVRWFQKNPAFSVSEQAGPHLWFLILNLHLKPFADRRVRQAVNYAVNKRALVDDVLQGTASVAAGPVASAFSWVKSHVQPYPYDPARARALLRAAGYARGFDVTFYVPEGGSGMLAPVQMATAIQADLARVGVRAHIETYEWNTYLAKVNHGLGPHVGMAEMAWMTNDPDTLPYLTLRSRAEPPAGFNSGYYSNPEVDRLIARARRVTDRDERAALYRRIQRLVHDDAPWLFVASWKQNAVTRAAVHGFRLEPSFFLLLGDTYKD